MQDLKLERILSNTSGSQTSSAGKCNQGHSQQSAIKGTEVTVQNKIDLCQRSIENKLAADINAQEPTRKSTDLFLIDQKSLEDPSKSQISADPTNSENGSPGLNLNKDKNTDIGPQNMRRRM